MLSLERVFELKDKFISFAEEKEMKKELKKEAEKEETAKINDRFKDWFLFEKVHADGKTTIEKFIDKAGLTLEEKELVTSWSKFVYSIFKVKKEEKDYFVLLNLVNNQKYTVYKDKSNQVDKGDHFIARLIPAVEDKYIFSEAISRLHIKSNDQVYNMVARFELDYPHSAFIDNKQKMDLSYRIQAKEYEDFVEFFGSDEIVVEGHEIPQRLHEFYHFRYFQNKDRNSGKTIAKIFREKYGTYPDLPLIELPEAVLSCGEVGIIYDKVEGLNFFPWYGVFKQIFSSAEFREIPGYKECVLEYLKADSISTLPFRKVIQEYPQNAIEVFKDVLGKKKFTLPDDYNRIMLKYKKALLGKSTEPSVIPMPERTKALLRTKRPEEYGSLNFYEGPNRYKDIMEVYELLNEEKIT